MKCRVLFTQLKLLSLFVGAVLAICGAPAIQAQNLLVNGSFEQPGTGKITSGFDSVTGWFSGVAPLPGGVDSGVETTGNPVDGIYSAFSNAGDAATDGIYANQTTTHVIQAGQTFNLSLAARPLYTFLPGFAGPANATLHYRLYYGGTATTVGTTFAEGFFDLGRSVNTDSIEPYQNHSLLGVDPPAAADGQTLGITLMNSSGGQFGDPPGAAVADPNNSWIGFDRVSLIQVPEPASLALLAFGGFGLGALRRRR